MLYMCGASVAEKCIANLVLFGMNRINLDGILFFYLQSSYNSEDHCFDMHVLTYISYFDVRISYLLPNICLLSRAPWISLIKTSILTCEHIFHQTPLKCCYKYVVILTFTHLFRENPNETALTVKFQIVIKLLEVIVSSM